MASAGTRGLMSWRDWESRFWLRSQAGLYLLARKKDMVCTLKLDTLMDCARATHIFLGSMGARGTGWLVATSLGLVEKQGMPQPQAFNPTSILKSSLFTEP